MCSFKQAHNSNYCFINKGKSVPPISSGIANHSPKTSKQKYLKTKLVIKNRNHLLKDFTGIRIIKMDSPRAKIQNLTPGSIEEMNLSEIQSEIQNFYQFLSEEEQVVHQQTLVLLKKRAQLLRDQFIKAEDDRRDILIKKFEQQLQQSSLFIKKLREQIDKTKSLFKKTQKTQAHFIEQQNSLSQKQKKNSELQRSKTTIFFQKLNSLFSVFSSNGKLKNHEPELKKSELNQPLNAFQLDQEQKLLLEDLPQQILKSSKFK